MPTVISRSFWTRARSLGLVVALLGGVPSVARSTIRFDAPLLTQWAGRGEEDVPVNFGVADFNLDGVLDVVAPAPESLALALGNGDGTFRPPIRVWAQYAGQIVAGDFDADGKPDIAHLGGVLFGDGSGHGWTRLDIPMDWAIPVAGDFDGDGRTDLAYVEEDGGTTFLRTLLSRPGRAFETIRTREDSLAGGWVWVLQPADFNGDGRLDLLVSRSAGMLSVLLGRGDGTFQIRTIDRWWSYHAAIGDVTGDGKLDLIVTMPSLALYPGLGDGTFGAFEWLEPAWTYQRAVALADFTGDGVPDLLASERSGFSTFRRGVAGGGFEEFSDLSWGQCLAPLVVVDLDRDERPDVLAMASDEYGIFVARGDGEGGFGAPTHDAPLPDDDWPRLVTGDFDRDGRADVVAIPRSTGTAVTTLLGAPDREFAVVTSPWTLSGSIDAVLAADVDEDSNQDVIVTRNGRVDWLRGLGDGRLAPSANLLLGGAWTVGDVNGDSHIDLVYARAETVVVVTGAGDATFAAPMRFALGPGGVVDIDIGDLNGDGCSDISVLTAQYHFGWTHYWSRLLGSTAGGIDIEPARTLPQSPFQYQLVGDVNLDGLDDVVMLRTEYDYRDKGILSVSLQSPGVPGPWKDGPAPAGLPVKLHDFDHDGLMDLMLLRPKGFMVARGDGAGGFAFESGYGGRGAAGLWAGIVDLPLGDFDGDGWLDAAVVHITLVGRSPGTWFNGIALSAIFGRDPEPPLVGLIGPACQSPLAIGQPVEVGWKSSDDEGGVRVDLFVSHHGRPGPFKRVELGLPSSGSHVWTVSGPPSDSVVFKVVARDASGNVAVSIGDDLCSIIGIVGVELAVPARLEIRSIAPNPASGPVVIAFDLPRSGRVAIDVHDLQGRRVARVIDEKRPAGSHRVEWSVSGSRLGSGLYFARLISGAESRVARITILE